MSLSNPPAPPAGRCLGALIAGGRSSRFGGDKALALLDGVPLIDHAARAIVPFVNTTIVCGRDHRRYASVADVPAPDLGPLGGIAAALGYAFDHGYDIVLTIGCDMPGVPEALIARLLAAAPAYCASTPILGCWTSLLGPVLAAHLAAGGDRSVRRWAEGVGVVAVPWDAPLPNINTPADLPSS